VKRHKGQGEAFVFTRPRHGWPTRIAKPAVLIAPHGSAGDELGASVAASGSTIAVGAPGKGTNCPYSNQSGYVEVYSQPRTGWRRTVDPISTLGDQSTASPTQLGYSLAIAGNSIISGVPWPCVQDDSQQTAGQIDVFTRPRVGWSRRQHPSAVLTAAYASLGGTLAASDSTIIAPVPANTAVNYTGVINSSAAAVVFRKGSGGWHTATAPSATIPAPANTSDLVAASDNEFSISGDTAIWHTTVIHEAGAGWSAASPVGTLTAPQGNADDFDGTQIATSSGYVFALTNVYGGVQHVLVFKQGPDGWSDETPVADLTVTGDQPAGVFMRSIAASGSTVAIGGTVIDSTVANSGVVYVFSEPAGGWAGDLHPSASLTASDAIAQGHGMNLFGNAVAVLGSTVFVGSPAATIGSNADQGAVYVYTEPAGGWAGTMTENAKLTVASGQSYDQLGTSLAAAGQIVVAGAPNVTPPDGGVSAAYVFSEPAGGWAGSINQAAKLLPPNPNPMLQPIIGEAVATDGSTVIAGAPFVSTQSHGQAAYLFAEPATGWSGTITAATTLTGASFQTPEFSSLTAVSGGTVIASTSGGILTGSQPAQIVVFREPAQGWPAQASPSETLTPSPAFGLGVPESLSLSGDTATVATSLATYVLNLPPG
jgi:hypothetical protein